MTAHPPRFAEHEFRKATASNPDRECVRVARRDGWVQIRDDKTVFGAPDDHRLTVTEAEFDSFLAGARAGVLDGHPLQLLPRHGGDYLFRAGSSALVFTAAEVAAFLDGVARHEFDPA